MKRRSIVKQLIFFTGGIYLLPSNNDHLGINNKRVNRNKLKESRSLLISELRPRLFVRASEAKIGRGLTTDELRQRIDNPSYKEWVFYNSDINDSEGLPAVAMQYLLYGKKVDALKVYNYLINHPLENREHTATAASVYHSAIAFDWIRSSLSNRQAENIIQNLIRGAELLKPGVEKPAINHNYTLVSLYGVAMVALAIYGEGESHTRRALEYIKLTEDLLESDGKLLDTFKAKKGTWTEGNHYSPYVVFQSFLMTIRALTTATNRDYFKLIKDRYDNFMAPMSKFIIANFRADFSLERIGDVTRKVVPGNTTMYPILGLLASEVSTPVLQGQIHSFSKALISRYGAGLVPDVYKWMVLVTYDSRLPDSPSYKTLPLVMRLGEGTYEQIFFRSSWEEDGTLITCVSGWHFTDHQHFDKGSFLIYKKGGLTVDGGGYSEMYHSSWANYSTRTLAHNCVIVHDPGEVSHPGIKAEIFPDGGQCIIRGAQSQTSWQEYLNMSKAKGLNTSRVLAFGFNEQYNYVKSNLTNAYNKDVTCMERQLLYFPGADYLIVKDLVITGKPLDKYWLLHFQDRPIVDGQTPHTGVTEYNGAEKIVATRTEDLKRPEENIQYSGKLFIKPILPRNRIISIIGGPGYEYYNRFVKKNFPPEKPFPSYRESGRWRLEVSPEKAERTTLFLHALEITDTGKKDMVPVKYIRSEDDKMEGVQFLADSVQHLGLFSSDKDVNGGPRGITDLPVRYTLQASGPTIHVLTEQKPGKKVVVTINNKDKEIFEVNDAGVLFFKDNKTGIRNIQITDY